MDVFLADQGRHNAPRPAYAGQFSRELLAGYPRVTSQESSVIGGPEDGSGSGPGSSPVWPRAVLRRSDGAPMAEPPVDLDEAMLRPLIQAQGSAALRTWSPRSSGPALATWPMPSSRRLS